ncbi:ABC transporter substrate-binding protein [Diaphorobacter sp. HDW4A]|uniref:siderophore ABC transporter substrate-binding protein n=1 Tax=Diaphorobacter sp. HDW4A TaxID=2714924 RepID=UPI00140B852F|nr:ABC transporter substrate-binding protein [Diaphorobacter sp. HDW4A]QIL82072.1 ABC transporter substrate-binding protein [Diaphorobacter sp. HDW4A]
MSRSRFNRRHTLLGLGLGLALAMPGAGALARSPKVTVKDASGEVSVPLKPKTVLVYDLSALDIIQSLGGDVQGVPNVVTMPKFLGQYADAAKYPQVGSLFEPDYEKVKSLKPDLIISGGRTQPKLEELRKYAPVLDISIGDGNQMPQVFRNIRAIAAAYGVPEKGELEIRNIEQEIANVKTKATGKGSMLFVMTNGGKMSVYGPGSRFDMLYSTFGATPVKDKIEVSKHGQAVSFEYLLKTNPDWLLVLDRDAAIGREGASAEKLLDNKLVHATKAWRNKQVVYLNATNWYVLSNAGPTAIKENLKQLSDAFAPAM